MFSSPPPSPTHSVLVLEHVGIKSEHRPKPAGFGRNPLEVWHRRPVVQNPIRF